MIQCTRFMAIVMLLLIAPLAWGEGKLDPKLQQLMATEPGPFQVIVSFKNVSDISTLNLLGVSYLPLTVLPMAGAVLTKEHITTLLSWENVESVYYNDRLQYFNHDAGAITGAHYVQGVLGFKGKGSTIVVLDSGIDATHPDLLFGVKVVENVKIVSDLGVSGTTAFVEGVQNTDNTSGHGTHVAGTVGGTGAASANDERDPYYYRGVAPESKLVGLGAGETLFILHALVGFDYAIANKDRFGVKVITNSWGNSRSQYDPNNPISKAAYEAYRRGIVVTFAAGNSGPNDNTMSTYAINPWVIGVAAGTKSKDLAGFSSRGEAGDPFEHPDITAPGVSITSTRAVGTPIGALGPVVNLNHPEYYTYYHTISGTSMATPFVAGTVALLREANPHLSPDQIEEIIMSTADPMPYQFHQAGAGYINVRLAVEKALQTTGTLPQFLSGDTKWSSQGLWVVAEERDASLGFLGTWTTVSNSNASGGAYNVGTVKLKGKKSEQKPYLRVTFYGTAIKLGYPTNSEGGTAEVLIDGVSRGFINYYSDAQQWNVRSAFGGLANTNHTLELRGLRGKIYLDNIYLDGRLFPSNTTFVEETTTYTGTMGPSVEGIPETHTIPFDVADNTIQIVAELGWSGGVDIDLYLLDPNGNTVASSASLDNPEAFSFWVTNPGTYVYKLVGYATVVANYTLTSTLTRAQSTTSLSKATGGGPVVQNASVAARPREFELAQNYPNPFNPQTSISYTLPGQGFVTLKVYNVLGNEVATVREEFQAEGTYRVWFKGDQLPSGVYLYRLDFTDEQGRLLSQTKRMVMVK